MVYGLMVYDSWVEGRKGWWVDG